MAALKKSPAKGKGSPKKGLPGRMPVKRSINLMLIDENKISPVKALLAIIVIVALAAAFGKFMVVDRLNAMYRAENRATTLKTNLEQAKRTLDAYEGIEDRYAHLTYAGMTSEEMNRVDRVMVLQLVSTILPEGNYVKSWSVSSNILAVDISGKSLQDLNEQARRIEESPIVDICAIATARKDEQKNTQNSAYSANTIGQALVAALEERRMAAESELEDFALTTLINIVAPLAEEKVDARFTIYLVQPPETEEASEDEAAQAAEGDEAGAGRETADGGAVEAVGPKKPSRAIYSAVATEADPAMTEPEEVSAP